MELALGIGLGLGLSAACGFRVFVPFLVLGASAATGHVTLTPGLEWLASPLALIVLSVATAVEIGAYFLPWLDNLLDSLASPAAVAAGIAITAALVTDVDPLLRWSLAVIAGGGVASVTQSSTVILRTMSTAMSGGLANPLVAAGELLAAIALSLLTVLLPFAAIAVVSAIVLFSPFVVWRRHRLRPSAARVTEVLAEP